VAFVENQFSRCNTLQDTAMVCCSGAAHCNSMLPCHFQKTNSLDTTRCNTLQHAATRCNSMLPWTLQHTVTVGCSSSLLKKISRCSTLQHTATNCHTLQPYVPLAVCSESILSMYMHLHNTYSCVYTYTYTYGISIHVPIHTYTRIYMYVCVCVCVCVCMPAYIQKFIYTCICRECVAAQFFF